MAIKQLGGVFGRNPTFNDVTIEGQLTFDGDIDINSDLKVDGDLDVTGGMTVDTDTLVVDAANNRVGIGTSSPASLLDVKGSTGNSVITLNSATAIDNYPSIGKLRFYSNDTSTNSSGEVGSVEVIGIGTWNGAANNAAMTFNLIQGLAGTTSPVEAMRIDSSGDLMVGTTSEVITDSSGTGLYYDESKGSLQLKSSGNISAIMNRVASEGDIVQFRNDGSAVGSIGVAGGSVYIDGGSSNYSLMLASDFRPRTANGAANNDAAVDLGDSLARFKDLYLSGGVNQSTVLVSELPAAASSTGYRFMVSDSTVAASGNFGATVAGSGSNVVPVFSDGTNWLIG